MLIRIDALLSPEQAASMRARLDAADWQDGKATAGHQSAAVKLNRQLPQEDAAARAAGTEVLRALERSDAFVGAALPRHVYPPLFNRYETGMTFGAHIDNAVRQIPGTHHRLRTDLAATLFLSAPEEYDGGELVIEDTYGSHSVKLGAGDLVVYSASSVHRVLPVTRGARMAAFFWIQSMVRDEGARTLLFEMDRSIRELGGAHGQSESIVRLTGCYHNLLRRWGEV
ncbi:MAG TPA: Fe2+-dependent dioxygenase [Steroidobacteraceae bacterium]|jgi:PKHD-type hydroxylase|nr:Fe2+-dependent dioxygenase [Steroidobacteraceae bacterium]